MTEDPEVLKRCCAAAYASPWLSLLLGECWHPGGLALTDELGRRLALTPRDLVADVAAGEGASARHLAKRYGCRVWALDLGAEQVARGRDRTEREGCQGRVLFQQGDAETLPWRDGSVDAVVCECALCTFPQPQAAVREWARVLRPGGRVGITDVTRRGPLPPALDSLGGWVGCLAGARPLAGYGDLLSAAGLRLEAMEDRSGDLEAFVARIGQALLAWLRFRGDGATLGGWSSEDVEGMLHSVRASIASGDIGYGLLTARRPEA